MYAISLYRYDLCINRGRKGKMDFCPVDFTISGILFFALIFDVMCDYWNTLVVSKIATVWELGRYFWL